MVDMIVIKTCFCVEENSEITGRILAISYLKIGEISDIITPKILCGPIKRLNRCKYFYHPSLVITKNICDYSKTPKANPIENTLHQAA